MTQEINNFNPKPNSYDYIHISNLRIYGYTGYLPEEQVLGQWFEVNLVLWVNTAKSAKSDRLEDTCDYSTIVKEIQHLVKTSRFALIEKLTEAIADIALTENLVDRVTVRLTKVNPPIPDFDGRVSVEITRPRF